jgi:hypothetical protein
MRDGPGRIERVVGVFVLVLTAGIVTGLAITVRPSDEKMFDPSPEYVLAETPPRSARIAAQMLPRLSSLWQWSEAPHAIRADAFEEKAVGAPADLMQAYDAAWAYRGVAAAVGAEPRVAVTVFDMRRPRNAFGVCMARRPDGARDAGLGRGGWTTGPRVAFWSGRYYTELDATGNGADAAADEIARSVSSLQLAYGGPFEAARILPAAGRDEGSFRYVARDAMGVDLLDDAFVAAYAGGVTGFVIEAAGPSEADAVVAAFRSQFQQAGTSVETPGTLGPHGAAGTLGPRRWVVAAGGRYAFGAAGPGAEAKPVDDLALAVDQRLGGLASEAASSVGAAPPAEPSRPKHFPEITGGGWMAPTDIRRFDESNLYEKIDGKAGIFLGYLFRELEFGTYRQNDRDWQFDVYVYDMGAPENAFGIYQTERSADAPAEAIGREGYASGASVFFWKGRYYVNVLGPPDDDAAVGAARELASAIEKTIEDEGGAFWVEAVLPRAGLKPGTLDYKATNAMGYGFLQRVFAAEYERAGKTYQVFLHRAASSEAARTLFEKYVAAVKEYNDVVSQESGDDSALIVSNSLGVYEVGFHVGVIFGGVTESDDAAVAAAAAKALRDRLRTAAIPAAAGEDRSSATRAPAPAASESASTEPKTSDESGAHGESGEAREY